MNIDRTKNSTLVGIISYGTYSDHMNYGACLHAYAFQKVLKDLGQDSVIIDYKSKSLSHHSLKFPILNYRNIFDFKRFAFRFINYTIGFFANIRKYKKFSSFIQTYDVTTAKQYTYNELRNCTDIEGLSIPTYVCESDVIWKLWTQNSDFDECFFLEFPNAYGKRKVAYSPSLSAEPFNETNEDKFRHLIKDFTAISVREKQGAEYLTKLLKRNVDWVLDPTLLLNEIDYLPLIKRPTQQKYVLLYTCMKDDQDMVLEAEKFAQKKGLPLIEISNFSINKVLNHHQVIDDCGIEEWLGYFKNADYIICNAFHGFCFSVIFKKDFYLFLRASNDYRMQSITEALSLENRLITSLRIITEQPPIDYELVTNRLNTLKKKSMDFIIKNIITL